MSEIATATAGIIPVLMVLVQMIKNILPEQYIKYLPIACVVLGILGYYLFVPWADVGEVFLQGLIVGLAATGLYENGNVLFNKQTTVVMEEEDKPATLVFDEDLSLTKTDAYDNSGNQWY